MKRHSSLILVALAGVTLAIIAWQFRLRFPFDDTFISFRYAEHLATGHGLVWNTGGAHTEGYTNFLFVLILSICKLIGFDLLLASQALGLIATIVTAIALQKLGARVRTPLAGVIAAALFLLPPLTWINALSGMETSVAIMFCILALLAFSENRLFMAFALSFLAALTRPEASVLGGLMLLVSLQSGARSKPLLPFALVFVLPLLLYALWKYWYFGNLLPNSFYIKVSESTKVFPGLQYARLFFMSSVTLVIATLGTRARRTHPVLVVAPLFVATLVIFYLFVTPLEGLYDRFLWPAYTTLCMTAAVGLHDLSQRLRVRALPWGILLLHFAFLYQSPRTKQSLIAHEDIWDASMEKIASELRGLPHSSNLTLAYGDAGYVVYHSGLRHLDLFGLNDTRIAHARSREERAQIVRAEKPNLLLLPVRDSAGCYGLVEDAYGTAYDSSFHPVASCDAFPYKLLLFARKSDSGTVNAILERTNDTSSIFKAIPQACIH